MLRENPDSGQSIDPAIQCFIGFGEVGHRFICLTRPLDRDQLINTPLATEGVYLIHTFPAILQHHDSVCILGGQIEIMNNHQYSSALFGKVASHCQRLMLMLRIKRRGRFTQQQNPVAMLRLIPDLSQYSGEMYPLSFTAGELGIASIHEARGLPGQIDAARAYRSVLDHSDIEQAHANCAAVIVSGEKTKKAAPEGTAFLLTRRWKVTEGGCLRSLQYLQPEDLSGPESRQSEPAGLQPGNGSRRS